MGFYKKISLKMTVKKQPLLQNMLLKLMHNDLLFFTFHLLSVSSDRW